MSRALVPAPQPTDSGSAHGAPGTGSPAPGENPLLLLHRLLRGRYWLAVLLALLLAPCSGAIGYFLLQDEYQSTATIEVKPSLPKVLFESELSSITPMFSSFLKTQANKIAGPRVAEMAMQSDTWQDAGGVFSMDELVDFQESLEVVQPRDTQLISVLFTHHDPAKAQAGAQAVVDAYMKIYREFDYGTEAERSRLLRKRESDLEGELSGIRANIQELAERFGTNDLSSRYASEAEGLRELKTELDSAKVALANAKTSVSDEADAAEEDASDYSSASVEEIALIDARMQSLLDERQRLTRSIEEFEATLRDPGKRSGYRLLKQQLESHNAEIETYAELWRTRAAENPEQDQPVLFGALGLKESAAQLQDKVDLFQEMYDKRHQETLAIGQANQNLQNLRSQAERLEKSLEQTNARIEQLDLESSFGGRVTEYSKAYLPASPANGRRRMQLALLGFLGGGGLGVGLVLLLGLLRPRIRDIGDAQAIRPRLLGAVPLVTDIPENRTGALIAAQSVHLVRSVLHANMHGDHKPVLTITSPRSGTGKTCFCLSLGLSFASAGTRTLLIDGDMVGRGLTRRTGASERSKLGHVLCRYGLISDEEREEALARANEAGQFLGEALVDLTYVSEGQLEKGLSLQATERLGLADALDGTPVEDCLYDVGVPNLRVLPVSGKMNHSAATLSPGALRNLLDELRALFDVILVDGGPLPGFTEATVMASCADGVVMMVSRGDHGGDIQRTLHHLADLGVPVAGMVLNRADSWDIARSRFSSSVSTEEGRKPRKARVGANPPVEIEKLLESVSGFDPLSQAVWLSTTHPQTLADT